MPTRLNSVDIVVRPDDRIQEHILPLTVIHVCVLLRVLYH